MPDLRAEDALRLGGWDVRYARVLATASCAGHAAAIIDSNGDEADIDLDLFDWVDGHWQEIASTNIGDEGSGYLAGATYMFGRAVAGTSVQVKHEDTTLSVTASPDGWWLWLSPTLSDSEA